MFYHVSMEPRQIGDVIPHGRFGEMYRQYRPGGPMPDARTLNSLFWEIALESSRQVAVPDAVSRLNCIFACEQLEHAVHFRDGYRANGGLIYRCVPVDAAIPIHRGDFTAISAQEGEPRPYVDFMSEAALRYWRGEPSAIVEVLIGGPIRIIEGPLKVLVQQAPPA